MLRALRDHGPQRVDQLADRLAANGRRPISPATVATALGELEAAALAAAEVDDQGKLVGRWVALPVPCDPLLDAVDLHGAHDFRHIYATWLEDAGIPARVIQRVRDAVQAARQPGTGPDLQAGMGTLPMVLVPSTPGRTE